MGDREGEAVLPELLAGLPVDAGVDHDEEDVAQGVTRLAARAGGGSLSDAIEEEPSLGVSALDAGAEVGILAGLLQRPGHEQEITHALEPVCREVEAGHDPGKGLVAAVADESQLPEDRGEGRAEVDVELAAGLLPVLQEGPVGARSLRHDVGPLPWRPPNAWSPA